MHATTNKVMWCFTIEFIPKFHCHGSYNNLLSIYILPQSILPLHVQVCNVRHIRTVIIKVIAIGCVIYAMKLTRIIYHGYFRDIELCRKKIALIRPAILSDLTDSEVTHQQWLKIVELLEI